MKNLISKILLGSTVLLAACGNPQKANTTQGEPNDAKNQSETISAQDGLSQEATDKTVMFTDFTIKQEDGTEVSLSDYVGKGKYVLVDFWASWCAPCVAELPNLKSVYEKYKGDNFEILGVAVWDKTKDTKKAIEEHKIPWPQILNAQKIPTDLYGIQGIPHIILFGPDGEIIKRDLRGEAIPKIVEQLVK